MREWRRAWTARDMEGADRLCYSWTNANERIGRCRSRWAMGESAPRDRFATAAGLAKKCISEKVRRLWTFWVI